MFFDRQWTPEELARSQYGRPKPLPAAVAAPPPAPKIQLRKEIRRKAHLALVWVNPLEAE